MKRRRSISVIGTSIGHASPLLLTKDPYREHTCFIICSLTDFKHKLGAYVLAGLVCGLSYAFAVSMWATCVPKYLAITLAYAGILSSIVSYYHVTPVEGTVLVDFSFRQSSFLLLSKDSGHP